MMACLQSEDWSWPEDAAAALQTLPAGHAFTVPDVLFAKITDESREDWATRFAGART
jgi:methionyl-tRNA synthetase